jgi:hypothetical protein
LRRDVEALPLRVAHIEELAWPEAHRSREQHGRKRLDGRVVFRYGVVEEPPRGGELVLNIGQLGLELLEVGVRLEVRIGFRECE